MSSASDIKYSFKEHNLSPHQFNNKVNVLSLAYATSLEPRVCKTNIRAQKINCSTLKIYEIVLAFFFHHDMLERVQIFEKISN